LKRPGEGLSPKPGATETWCFLRFLPLVFSDLIEVDNNYWKLFILFQEIIDIIFSSGIYESTLLQFEDIYAEFLSRFKALFPNVNIKPKYHFLIHFQTVVRKNGPPKAYWIFNYKRLNGSIKIPSRVMNNFKNPAKTLVYRRQSTALHHLLHNDFQSLSFTYGAINYQQIDLDLYDYDEILFSDLVYSEQRIPVLDKVINGSEYRKGVFLIMDRSNNGDLVFGKISIFVCPSKHEPLFVVSVFKTLHFDYHSFSYCIQRRVPFHREILKIKDLC
jgi:hypothetical protein